MTDARDIDRHALVTGAGRRVGAAIARALAAAGWSVTIHHHDAEEEAETLACSIRADGGTARTCRADLSDPNAAAALIEAVDEATPLSLLVNNAAIFRYDAPPDVTAESLAEHFSINAAAPILLAQAFAAAKRRRKQTGAVVNMLDNKIFAPNADYFSYSVAKFALAGATRMLAMALAPEVRVCGVAPGLLLASGGQSEEDFERTRAVNPARQPTGLDDLCRAVLFLAETESMNGEIVTVDRGQTLLNLPRDVAFLDAAVAKGFQWDNS